jgi:hypothetical protein
MDMTVRTKTAVAALALVIAAPAVPVRTQAPAESPSSFANTPLTRIGVVVRDVQRSAKVYADVFQLEAVPAVTTVKIEMPKGSARVKRALVALPNATIEIDQPDGNSPAADYLKKYGQGIYRMGFSTSSAIQPKVAALEQHGGKLIAGSPTGTFAWVDMNPVLGTTIELHQETVSTAKPPAPPAPVSGKVILGKTAMSHLGYASTNSDQLAKDYADAFGIKPPVVRDYKPVEIPPNYKADPNATLRLTSFSTGGPGIELIQSLGQTNWADFVSRHGNHSAPQHLAFPVGDLLQQTVRLFESKGGQWTNGKVGGTYMYLDFTETLGIIFELNGAWKE